MSRLAARLHNDVNAVLAGCRGTSKALSDNLRRYGLLPPRQIRQRNPLCRAAEWYCGDAIGGAARDSGCGATTRAGGTLRRGGASPLSRLTNTAPAASTQARVAVRAPNACSEHDASRTNDTPTQAAARRRALGGITMPKPPIPRRTPRIRAQCHKSCGVDETEATVRHSSLQGALLAHATRFIDDGHCHRNARHEQRRNRHHLKDRDRHSIA